MEAAQLRYVLALLMVPKVGSVTAKNLIAYCGSAEDVFKQKTGQLLRIPGIGKKLSYQVAQFNDWERVDKEMAFMEKHNIRPLYFYEPEYPRRLKDAPDAPVVLFYKGNTELNVPRVLAVVGTRKGTPYGRNLTEKLIEGLAGANVLIVSGLALGIDAYAHKAALHHSMPTVAALGHGLDMIYPANHRPLAAQMLENGGLLTEYPSGVKPDRQHFPARNRIVAGISDAVVLVETGAKGGALITAEIANSYNREVYAFPGRVGDPISEGCNHFIKINKACLIESADDILYQMGWEGSHEAKPAKQHSYGELTEKEAAVVGILREKEKIDLDSLCILLDENITSLSMRLLDMEFRGILQALPGKFYRLVS